MFPTVKVRLSGLDPAASYIVFLDIVPVDDKRYRYVYHSSQWMVAGSGDPPLPHNVYVHPDSPATGQLWMAQGVVAFDKLKLTNNRKPLVRGQVSLHSMHKYLPRVHILPTTDLETPAEQQASVEHALTYTFPETAFTTVTAYQNQQITRLKIASNPFAKGFREASRTRDSLDDTRHQRPSPFPSPPLLGPSKYCSGDLFGLHPDFSLPPSPVFLHGRPSLDPYCPSAMATTSSLFHSSHSLYGCQPLTMPVKFVVPPASGTAVLHDTARRICVDDQSQRMHPEEDITKLSTDVHTRRLSPNEIQSGNFFVKDCSERQYNNSDESTSRSRCTFQRFLEDSSISKQKERVLKLGRQDGCEQTTVLSVVRTLDSDGDISNLKTAPLDLSKFK